MITQSLNTNLIPGQVKPRVNVSQYDKSSRTLSFSLYNGNQAFNISSGMTAMIEGSKPDGHGFQYNANVTVGSNVVTATLTQQMAVVAGEVNCEIVILLGSERLATGNFVIDVEPAALNDTAIPSDSELPMLIALATEQMENAEAWAAGTKNGSAVSSSDPQYHNNSKYYSQQASSSATTASTKATEASNSASTASTKAGEASSSATTSTNQALKSEGYAVGTQNGTAVQSGTYFHNNSKYYSQQASASADRAEAYSVNVPYIGANGNWWVWNTSSGAYVDSGVDASITVQIADITMLEPTANPYVTNTGTDTDPVFHLYIPRGKGIASIAKTNTSGLVDTYTITYSDGATTTFTVTNGKGISSITKESTSGLVDTYKITYNSGNPTTYTVTNGRGINTISKTSSSGLADIYTIAYNDGTTTTFTVTNGKTAYQSAVEGGYQGTEEQFESDLANFKTYKDDAETAASNAANSATSAAGSVTQAHQEYLDAKNQADRAQAYADFIEPHFIIQDNRLYIKDDAVGEFVVADNRLYMKLIA